MLVVRAASLDDARALANSDPFVSSGAETCEVRQFTQACLANDFLRR